MQDKGLKTSAPATGKTIASVRPFAAAAVFYLTLSLVLSYPFLFLNKALYLADVTYNIEPAVRFMRQEWWRTGHCPLWNPFVLCGAPQIQVLWPVAYMPGYIGLLVPFSQATGLFLLIHYFVAGMGGFLWQYCHERSAQQDRFWPALFFGLLFMFSGYMTGSSINLGLLACASWVPLVLFLLDRLARRPHPWCLGLTGLVIGQQVTTGRPELVVLSCLLYLTYLLFGCWRKPDAAFCARHVMKTCLMLGAAITLALTFAAVDLVPMLELVAHAPAVGSLSALPVTYWSAGWFDFTGMLLSQPSGRIGMASYHLYPTYPGANPYISSLYLGAPALTLAAVGFLARGWQDRWFFLVWCAFSFLVSAGEFAGLIPVLAKAFPDLTVFRFPIKASVFLILGLAVAAAQGWRAAAAQRSLPGVARLFVCLWALVALCAFAVPANLSRELAIAGLSGVLTCLLVLSKGRLSLGSLPGAVMVMAVVGVLLTANGARHLWDTVDGDFYRVRSTLADWLAADARQDPQFFRAVSLMSEPLSAPDVVLGLPEGDLEREFMQYAREVLKPNTNADASIRLSNGVSTIPTWGSYFLSAGLLPRSHLSERTDHPAGKSDLPLARWCQATTTRYLLTDYWRSGQPAADREPLPLLDQRLFKLVRAVPKMNLRVYEVPSVRPRFSLIARSKTIANRYEALKDINRADTSGYAPDRYVIITDPDPGRGGAPPQLGSTAARAGERSAGSVKLTSETLNQLSLSVEASQPAFLVITDSYYPGWQAGDNGRPTKIFLADGLLRAIHLEPGKHEIVLSYRPKSLFVGSILSKITLLFMALLAASALVPWLKGSRKSGAKD